MALLTALFTSAAVTSLVTWNGNRSDTSYTTSGDITRAFDASVSSDAVSHPTLNSTDFRSPTTTSDFHILSMRSTTAGTVEHVRSERVAIAKSIRLYGIVVAACLATVVAVALAATCVVARGGSPTTATRWGSSWLRQLHRGHAVAELAAAAGGGDSDYIYRPLGTGLTGNRLDDEYETTFVGVSVPLLHDVRAV